MKRGTLLESLKFGSTCSLCPPVHGLTNALTHAFNHAFQLVLMEFKVQKKAKSKSINESLNHVLSLQQGLSHYADIAKKHCLE